ncbi:biliverdin-producing heme oxygenase [Lentzea sp. NPDC003310]|uniref:biliverdin-producing heme oxygenase n=1 Tax=Lentzea sp. NPDC003310 TaxID=3154447 RepID=UPI0033AF38AF
MTLLARLRGGTDAAHRALEDDLAFLSRLGSPQRYEDLLGAFLGFHEPLDKALAAATAAQGLPWTPLADADRLAWDLQRFGWSPARIAALPRCSPPDVETLPALIGSLYVVEGARLGGQLITRWIADSLGPVPVSFFAGDGDARRRFRRFGAVAEAALSAEQVPDAVEAANRHFLLVRDWLAEAGL